MVCSYSCYGKLPGAKIYLLEENAGRAKSSLLIVNAFIWLSKRKPTGTTGGWVYFPFKPVYLGYPGYPVFLTVILKFLDLTSDFPFWAIVEVPEPFWVLQSSEVPASRSSPKKTHTMPFKGQEPRTSAAVLQSIRSNIFHCTLKKETLTTAEKK